jgi:hypothetical protein
MVTVEPRPRQPFVAVKDAKGWNEPDIVMEQVHVTIGIAPQGSGEQGKQNRRSDTCALAPTEDLCHTATDVKNRVSKGSVTGFW